MDNSLIRSSFPVALTKRVEGVMSALPSDYLKEYGKKYVKKNTPKKHQQLAIQHLLKQWQEERDHNNFLGKCLKAAFGGGGGNPALEARMRDEMSEDDYNMIYAVIAQEVAMFSWMQIGWIYIEANLRKIFIDDYPKSETEFFFEVLKEAMDGHFKSFIHGKKINVSDLENHYRKLKNLRGLAPSPNSWINEAKREEVHPTFEKVFEADGVGELPLFNLAIDVCHFAAKIDEPLQRALRDWSLKSSHVYRLLEDYARQGRKDKSLKSQYWKAGVKHEGTKGGYRIVTNP
jgi:hypothetical protein